MIFVDGNYFQRNVRELYPDKKIVQHVLADRFIRHLKSYHFPELAPEFIRMYYYDAIPDDPAKEKPEHKELLNQLRIMNACEVRTGRVKTDGNGNPRQKGVDTLVALDMVSKAYEDHYDIAILVAGDDDFLDIVKAVKNAGKRVVGEFFEKHISEELRQSFDYKVPLNSTFFENLHNRVFYS